MDSDSDLSLGGSGDEDTSFTPSHEEEEQQQDENIVPAIVTPTTQKKKQCRFSLQEKLAYCGICDDASTMVRLKPLHVVP